MIRTYTHILYQIVFSTLYREKTLIGVNRKKLYAFMGAVLREKSCQVFEINGTEDHVHIVTHIHPSVALADIVKKIKLSSSEFIKDKRLFPDFSYWQEGYGAFTYPPEAKDNLTLFARNQDAYHRHCSSLNEYKDLLRKNGVGFDEDLLR